MTTSEKSAEPLIGERIEENSKSYDRIYGMLLGIRVHVGLLSSHPMKPLDQTSFQAYEKIDIPREGNHYAPGHTGPNDYKFKAYAPVVFAYLRQFFGITPLDYTISLTADYMLSELKTLGKSSAMFYYTYDGRYVFKTLTKDEMKVLRKILPAYYEYVTTHPDTLINQFFGAYRSQTSMGRPIRFVVMNNVFPIGYQLSRKYDLKGSTVGRSVPPEKRAKKGTTWKDVEFAEKHHLKIGPRDWSLLKAQLMDDTNFLARIGVMDYSLLIGVHKITAETPFLQPALGEKIQLFTLYTPNISTRTRYRTNSLVVRNKRLVNGKQTKRETTEPTMTGAMGDFEIAQSIQTSPSLMEDQERLLSFHGGLRATDEQDQPLQWIYFFGIIDFLQEYTIRKSAEHAFKSLVYPTDTMSCIPPDRYATRMMNYLVRTIENFSMAPRVRRMRVVQPRARESIQMTSPLTPQQSTEEIVVPTPPPPQTEEPAPEKKRKHKHRKHHKKSTTEAPEASDSLIKSPKKKHKHHTEQQPEPEPGQSSEEPKPEEPEP